MRPAGRFAGMCALWLTFTGCTTTGDPHQGGLFGWSEAKARDRQQDRQDRVAGAEAQLGREDTTSRALQASNDRTDRQIATAQSEHDREEATLHTQQAALVAKTEQLENESPTPAGASRARAYRRKVNTVVAQTALPIVQRQIRLRALENEIDAALEQLKR